MNQETKGELRPKMRFPEFLDASDWENEPLGQVYSFIVTNSLSRDKLNYENGTVKNIHYGDIHTKFSTLFDIDIENEIVPFINPSEPLENIKLESYCIEGDMIFADASEDLEDVGKSIELVHLNNEKLLSGLHTLLARQKKEKLIFGFGGYLFKSSRIRTQIRKEAQGAKGFGISAGRLSKIDICFPSDKKEQQKIADCLSSIDEMITAHSQKLDTLKNHKKGLLQQLFPAEGETMPQLRFPEFLDAPEWGPCELGSKVTKVGSGITPNGGEKKYKDKGRPFVRSQNVGWGELILDDVAFIDEATHATFPATEIIKGDVLLNITGASIGRSAVADGRIYGGNVNQHVCIIRLNYKELNPKFLNQFLLSQYGQKQIESFQAGGNRQGLNFAQIRSFSIPLPPKIEEQIKIADFLSSLNELIVAQSQKLDLLRAHKKGLLQQLFPSPEEALG